MTLFKYSAALFCASALCFAHAMADGSMDESEAAKSGRHGAREKTVIRSGATLEGAKGEQLAVAMGHYARARSLLISAINEFDSGYKLAKPDGLLDSREWRNDLISRAEDLEKVLAPQGRLTEGGVKYEANPAFTK